MKQTENQSFKAEFKPGTYFIGDPCYALRDDLYDKWETDNDYADGNYGYFAVGSTAYGDGLYSDSYSDRNFGVDAGVLGIVNLEYSAPDCNIELLNKLGQVIVVEKCLIFEYDSEAHIFYYKYDDNQFIEIHTAEDDEYEEDIENGW